MDDELKLILGRLLSQQLKDANSIQDSEFKVFSQFGDDGMIQFLVSHVKSVNHYFIEFGVENYLESNTRFLLQNNNWGGLIMDGSKKNIDQIKSQGFYWKHDLTAVQSFITAENINEVLLTNLPEKNIGLLHIDIDGNDYWVWRAINCIDPVLVIIEYNSVFGNERAITIPYIEDFVRNKYHYSNLYAGASLSALCDLADEKGYYFVGSNSAGNNAYFIKKDFIGDLRILSVQEGYVESKFRESRDQKGNLTFLRSGKRLAAIKGMKVLNTRTNQLEHL